MGLGGKVGQARVPGKAILFGEHAVVYCRPAIAVPVNQVWAEATVCEGLPGGGIAIQALDLGLRYILGEANVPEGGLALAVAIQNTLEYVGVGVEHDLEVIIHSSIPIARGLGSGAAVSVALIRALSAYFQRELSQGEVSELAYQVERLHHGTPSGIDNTVVAYEKPVYFLRGQPPELLRVGAPLTLVIADTGVPSPTRVAVSRVREAWERDRNAYEALFDSIGDVVRRAREVLEAGRLRELGSLMGENQELLRAMEVSSPELEALVGEAKRAGAWGAKLSGAGCGGNMIALVHEDKAGQVREELLEAGAASVIITRVA